MPTPKTRERVMVGVRTPIGDRGFGFLHESPSGPRFFLHARILQDCGFSAEQLTTEAGLEVDLRKTTEGWEVIKVHAITSTWQMPQQMTYQVGDRVSGSVMWFEYTADNAFGEAMVGGVVRVFVHASHFTSMSDEQATSIRPGTQLQFTLAAGEGKTLFEARDVTFA